METRLLVAAVLLLVVLVVARRLERRRPAPPSQGSYPVPAQLDRADFPRPDAPWIVVLFSSRTCDSCAPMADKVAALESDVVATCDIEAVDRPDLHRRYGVEGVPTVVLAGPDGVVRAGFVGAVSTSELSAALADARQSGGGTAP